MENNNKIQTFTDLLAWQEGHKLVLLVCEIINKFPREEKFALTDQMRRCVISITSNIAEGFSRQSPKEKIQFYSIAKGSNTELLNQLIIAKDVKYLSEQDFEKLSYQSVKVGRFITGLIKFCKR